MVDEVANKLDVLAHKFRDEIEDTLSAAFQEDSLEPRLRGDREGERFTLRVTFPLDFNPRSGDPYPSGIYSATIAYRLMLSERSKNLAVAESSFQLHVGTAPVLRFEYERDKEHHPAAHIHFHGVGNWLSPALMINRPSDSHRQGKLEALHIPVGGHRFRPSIEEFIYFLINECGFAGKDRWEEQLIETRDSWRDIQLRASVRDNPQAALETLISMGYEVTSPECVSAPKRPLPGW